MRRGVDSVSYSKGAHLLPKTQTGRRTTVEDVRDYSTNPMNGGCVQVAPATEEAETQSPYGQRKNGSMFPSDRHQGLLEAAPDALVITNRGGEIVLVNIQMEKQC